MIKHTPGPWKYCRTSGFDYGSTIYRIPGICTNVDTEADARLIAAAPELLAFIEEYVYAFENGMAGESYLLKIAKTAIAKATGEKA